MVFESFAKSAEISEESIKELKNNLKLVELDLEKRMILLENSVDSLHASIGSIQQFESSKDAILQIQEIKNTLREIEDTSLISKLETIDNGDKITAISEGMGGLNNKITLLSGAIEVLGESKSRESGISPAVANDVSLMKTEIASVKSAISKVSSSVPSPEKIAEISGRVESLEKAGNALNHELKKMYEAYSEKIDILQRRISSSSSPPGIPKEAANELSGIRGEIDRLKDINKKLVQMIEIDSSAIQGLKSLRDESAGNKSINSAIAELSKKVSGIEREMNLERAMYPQNIMKLEKDVANLKSSLKGVMENIITSLDSSIENKMKKEASRIAGTEKRIASIEAGISDKLKAIENAALKESSELKNALNSFEGKLDELNGKVERNANERASYKGLESRITELSKKVSGISQPRDRYGELEKDISGMRAAQEDLKKRISALDSGIAKSNDRIDTDVADEEKMIKRTDIATRGRIKELESRISQLTGAIEDQKNNSEVLRSQNDFLRQEIGQLKQACAEIIKETREQPIIID